MSRIGSYVRSKCSRGGDVSLNRNIDVGVMATTRRDIRNRVLGLVVLVLGLGAVLTMLESGLSGQPIPSYISSGDFDHEAYGRLFYEGDVVCAEAGEIVFSGGVECVPFDDHGGLAYPAVMTALAVAGAALILRWNNQIGWLLILGPLVDLTGAVATAYAIRGAVIEPGSLPASRLAAVIGSVAWILLLVVIVPRFLMTIPNGRLPSNGWRWAVRFTYVVAAVLGLSAIFHPMLVGSIPNPIRAPWSVETADSLSGVARVIGALRRRLTS
jgi:hypothetical protein